MTLLLSHSLLAPAASRTHTSHLALSLSQVVARSELEGIGVFTAYRDGRVRCLFADRYSCLRLSLFSALVCLCPVCLFDNRRCVTLRERESSAGGGAMIAAKVYYGTAEMS